MKTDKDNLGCYCLKISKIAKRKVESFETPTDYYPSLFSFYSLSLSLSNQFGLLYFTQKQNRC